jgi:rhamnosyltransferase
MKFHCAVVIPVKNAISVLPQVLDKVTSQNTPWPFEIIVIDSGSRDGTVEYLRQRRSIRLIEIPQNEFGHGKTRNLGVDLADAEFVAFLTHDAEPVDENWLINLVTAAEQDPAIAGVFGRHIAYQTASPFTRKDIHDHFEGFLKYPLIVSRDLNPLRYETDIGWKQLLHFYSDNNSLMRKSVWKKLPYPDVEFAEDQIWAKNIIEAGYRKAYAPNAAVYHSHDFGFLEQLRRSFDESRNFSKYFGYRLSSGPRGAMASAVKVAVQAFRQRLDNEYGKVTLKNRMQRAGQRVALVIGHFLGANHERLPHSISSRLSLDRRLFEA